uniref:Globin domain containing protein n=1 Tax=Haemonchus contortus TaxID=6289 RepID=A0A7I4YFK7_HAECO
STHQFAMLRLVALLSLVAVSMTSPSPSGSSSSSDSPVTAGPSRGKELGVDEANVVIETKLKFNPGLNTFFMDAFREAVKHYAHANGVEYSDAVVQERTHQLGDKLAVEYLVHGVDCEQLGKFLSAGKMMTNHLVKNVIAICNGRPMPL